MGRRKVMNNWDLEQKGEEKMINLVKLTYRKPGN